MQRMLSNLNLLYKGCYTDFIINQKENKDIIY